MSAHSESLGTYDITRKRHVTVELALNRLQHLAWSAVNVQGLNNNEFVIVSIEVDSKWRPVVDVLAPHITESDWQEIRDNGAIPFARGSAPFDVCDMLTDGLPHLRAQLLEIPQEGDIKCVVLDDEGCSIYGIRPIKDKMLFM